MQPSVKCFLHPQPLHLGSFHGFHLRFSDLSLQQPVCTHHHAFCDLCQRHIPIFAKSQLDNLLIQPGFHLRQLWTGSCNFKIQPAAIKRIYALSLGSALSICLGTRKIICLAISVENELMKKWQEETTTQKYWIQQYRIRPHKTENPRKHFVLHGFLYCIRLLWTGCWCRRRDLNSHDFRHYPLKIACLPIPPRRRKN